MEHAINEGFLGSFLSKNLRTNQLEVNTDEKTLRPIARLKEPRDLFALPKDKDHECSQQQAPRWPIECQVIEERIIHIPYVPTQPEAYNQPTGAELKPRPVGEENGMVVFNYNPISAVNYGESGKLKGDSSDSDMSSSESRASTPECSTPDRRKLQLKNSFTSFLKRLDRGSSSNSNDESCDEVDDDDENDADVVNDTDNGDRSRGGEEKNKTIREKHNQKKMDDEIEDIWADVKKDDENNKKGYVMPKVIAPVRISAAQMARLTISKDKLNKNSSTSTSNISNNSSSSSSNNNSSSSGLLTEDSTDDNDGDGDEDDDDNDDDGNDNANDNKNRNAKFNTDERDQPDEITWCTSTITNITSSSRMRSRNDIENELIDRLTRNLERNLNAKQNIGLMSNQLAEQEGKNSCTGDSSQLDDIKPSASNSDSLFSQFSRSAFGGSKLLTNCHPYNSDDYDGLVFEARFESGNLAKAVQITKAYYELYLRPDLYTSRSKQWFYFRVSNTKKDMLYRFSIVNLVKSDSLYNDGMRPLMYSTINAKQVREGWKRCGTNICYYRNDDDSGEEDDENASYTLTFNIEFPHDNDTVYFAHSYPYTYSDLQDYLMAIQKDPIKSRFCKLRLLCRSLAGNNVYYLTVTAPTKEDEPTKRKKCIVVSARVHPSETPSSWMMKGLMDFITGDTIAAKRLRHKFIFKLIPMLNPDGVIVGNTRNSLTGKDLNRQYRTVIRETYPSIWYTKAMIRRLIDESGVAMYCDMHAHSRKHNIFIYGCENKRNPEKHLTEQVFPLMMHKNVADKFSFEGCKFKIQRSKEGTGRIVIWMLGITNSYTIEASFGGSSLGSRKGTHFTTTDYEHIGRAFCETLLDYCDENPTKVKKQMRLFKQIKKIRRRERREKKALKLKKMVEQERLRLKIIERLLREGSSADEPLNIPLSDYSSDEGDSTSSSENEGKGFNFSDLEGPCCSPLKAPPCTPEANIEVRKFKFRRMRKVMRELDRIYFQPLLKRHLGNLLKNMKRKEMLAKRRINKVEMLKQKALFAKTNQQAKPRVIQKMPSTTAQARKRRIIARPRIIRRRGAVKKPLAKKTTKLKTRVEHQRIKVSRKLRLWLAKRRIYIYRCKPKRRKSKFRSKSSHVQRKKNEIQRIALDLPTTDPCSDLHFSTDDEFACNPINVESSNTLLCARRALLQSELQRRYIEEIGDGSSNVECMPPELIITSPKKQQGSRSKLILPKTAPEKGLLSVFPSLMGAGDRPARRTSSWHNLHNSGKCIPKLKIQNPSQPTEGDNTDLQFRLSLKKKIWTGVQPESAASTNYIDRTRLISWGAPALATYSKKEIHKKDENEALLTACSKKLLDWQREENKLPGTSTIPEISTVAPFDTKPVATHFSYLSKIEQKQTTKFDGIEGKLKVRKRKNPLSKIAETTQLITRLAKSKTRTTMSTQRQFRTNSSVRILQSISTAHKPQGGHKFKASGIAATAAVHPKVKRTKQLRALGGGGNKLKQQSDQTAIPFINPPSSVDCKDNSGADLKLHLPAAIGQVRKAKPKPKKKKPVGVVVGKTAARDMTIGTDDKRAK